MTKAVKRAIKILLGISVVVAIGLFLAQDQEVLRIHSARVTEDPDHMSYLAALVDADITSGNRYDVLTNGDQIFPAMLEAIRGAKRRISFETYIYESGQMADQFTTAFEEAARRGVRVNMVLDAVGSTGISDDHLARLRNAGCRIAEFNSPTWYSLEEVNYRTHRKILVVDGQVGFTGGVGIADHWMGNAEGPQHWRDTQVRITGPIVRLIEGVFYENFIETAGELTPELDPPPAPVGDVGPSIAVRSSPTGGANDLKRLYLLAIASARRTLDITTPYFVTDESSEWSLAQAVKRGVKVRILLESKKTDALPVKYASRHAYERLLQLGLEIYEYEPTMMHAKVLVVDGNWSMFGSANFDNRSLELNDELNVAVTSHDLAARFLQDFERDLSVSSRIELDQWRRRPMIDKIRERFWSMFGEVF